MRREDITTPIVSLVYDIHGEVAAGVARVDAVVRIFSFSASYDFIVRFTIFPLAGEVSDT